MTKDLVVEKITDPQKWKEISQSGPYVQSEEYGRLQLTLGRKVERTVIKKGECILAYYQTILYPLWKHYQYCYVPYGPVFTNEPNAKVQQLIREDITNLSKSHSLVFVRLDPVQDYPLMKTAPVLPGGSVQVPGFLYRSAAHQARGEWILSIDTSADDLLANMHKKTRYNIRKSERDGLETTHYYGNDILQHFETFIELNTETTQAHQTTTHDREYFKTFFETIAQSQENFVSLCHKDNRPLAINVFVRNGKTVFCPFGANSEEGKKLGAYYNLKWAAILEMQSQGIEYFSWGGVAIGKHDKNLRGLNKFKQGFGGYAIEHADFRDVVTNKGMYLLYLAKKFIDSLR